MSNEQKRENMEVTLREVTRDTLGDIIDLSVSPEQTDFVSPNAESIAEAYFEKHAWFRAIYADDTPVGFVMTFENRDEPFYYLWRYMIDAEHQGNGYGGEGVKIAD